MIEAGALPALHFEHVGPEDASGPPFVIAAGSPACSTEVRWLVPPTGLAQIASLVRRHGNRKLAHDASAGTFAVNRPGHAPVFVPPAGMKAIFQAVRKLYAQEEVPPPPMLVIHERLLQAPEKTQATKSPKACGGIP